jgi:penicillin-binding protein 2
MPKDNEKQRIFTRRALVFGGVQAAAFTVLASRLYYLQFIKAAEYATLSENNRIKLQLMTPERGVLLDRLGVAMATNEKNYRAFIDYSGLAQKTFQATLARAHTLINLPEKKLKQLERARVSSASMPELLKEHLSWEEVSLLELHMLDLPGIFIDIGQVRYYPFLEQAAHMLGYVGAVDKKDLSEDAPPLMRQPDFKIGKNGVEKMLEDMLRGSAGIRQLEVNVHGVPVREIGKTPSIPGKSVRLTIDSRLQAYASDLVKDESAAVVVMDIATGDLRALVSMPGFDPNVFSTGISTEYWKKLRTDPKAPLLNKAISGQYPPGSTFKMVVGMAGLEAGIINEHSSVFCPGHFYLGNHQFNCWKEGGHGTVNYHEAIAQSCDTFFYTIAQRMGIERFADMARRLGLGHTHGLGIDGEKPGIIPDPKWKMARYKQKWAGGDTINCAIGQGYVLATPLQLCIMTARMASGLEVTPRLWAPDDTPPEFSRLNIAPQWLEATQKAMDAVTNGPTGTAHSKRITDPRFVMAGKTGTSQVRKILQRGMKQELLPWEARHHALFVGYAPVDVPKYAICVVVEHGGGGSAAAAPVARDVLLKIQQFDINSTES